MSLRVFISSVTDEKAARDRPPDSLRTWVADELRKCGAQCVYQEFLVEQGVNTLVKLAQCIEREVEFVVHIVGNDAGSVPPPEVVLELLRHCGEDELQTRFPWLFKHERPLDCEVWQRLTYTQWEAWLGKFYEKDVLLCQATNIGDGVPSADPGVHHLALAPGEHIRLLKPYAGYPSSFASREDLRDLIQKSLLRRLQSGIAQVKSCSWPNSPVPQPSRLADRQAELQLFLDLLSPECPVRVLLIHGPSDRGKSSMLREYRRQLEALPTVVCGDADFKGGASLRDVLGKLARELTADVPFLLFEEAVEQSDQSGLPTAFLQDLWQVQKPVVILLDTYEEANDECRLWFEELLLPLVRRSESVRIVITGHRVPDPPDHWLGCSYIHELLPITEHRHWREYIDLHGVNDISDTELSAIMAASNGSPSVVSGWLAMRKVRI